MTDLLTIKEAADWATKYLQKNVTISNISYLIQYGRIKKQGTNGMTTVFKQDLIEYYESLNGQRIQARKSYIEGILQVLINPKKYFQDDYDIFLVSNDKYNLYPTIAEKSGMYIINQYKRPVLNRTEKDKSAYAEINLKNVA
jgi:hypothetical protein